MDEEEKDDEALMDPPIKTATKRESPAQRQARLEYLKKCYRDREGR